MSVFPKKNNVRFQVTFEDINLYQLVFSYPDIIIYWLAVSMNLLLKTIQS